MTDPTFKNNRTRILIELDSVLIIGHDNNNINFDLYNYTSATFINLQNKQLHERKMIKLSVVIDCRLFCPLFSTNRKWSITFNINKLKCRWRKQRVIN